MRRNFVIITSIGLSGLFFGLFGCENDRNSDQICKNNPQLCADLHRDSWCRYEKGDLIRHRYQLMNSPTPSGKQLFDLLIHLEDYSNCIELAAGVEHILHPERTQDRKRAFAVSTQTLAELREYTKDNPDLHLAYYRWLRFNDFPSLQIVLDQFEQGLVNDNQIKASLASHFVRIDQAKSKALYLELLSVDDPDGFNTDWLLGLASVYQRLQDFENAYLFTKANILMTDNKADERQLLGFINGNKQLANQLDTQAQALVDSIESGNFATSEIGQKLINLQ
ncbi:DUF2989 domain-containing protein [Shewanella sp. WXL01]|nr:DUF2989 domain-containing protein [Shewanella sp. WXL01]